MKTRRITGWGLYPVVQASIVQARYQDDLIALARQPIPCLAQGSCFSYGDACLSERVVSILPLRHLLAFDPELGRLRAQAGITLEEIIRFSLPRGWFLPVTPGTKYPTLGGCIAADVHGKNHHVDGAIGSFVDELEMVLADGSQVRCSRSLNPDLFQATLGGMGLTGFIYAATLRLRKVSSAYVRMHSFKTGSLAEACRLLAETGGAHTYSVAWIDCLARDRQLGRSIVMLGNHVPAEDAGASRPLALHAGSKLNVPFFFPQFVLNSWSMKAFNTLYYNRQLRHRAESIVHYDPFFYPLDAVGRWNRIYGRGGFLQYQFAIPFTDGQEIVAEILRRIAARRCASFLAVLKTFGPQEEGLLAFPIPGYTLALDISLRQPGIIPFLRELNKTVVRAGGRNYLAKDAILEREDFEAMYPGLEAFKRIKRRYDPDNHFRSVQADRLGIA
jgi:decaprenylphospho-beta-D-ribofuranose 2-oxidase